MSAREAVAGVSSGARIYVPMFHDSPALLQSLAERADVLQGVEIRGLAAVPSMHEILGGVSPGALRGNWSFGTPATRTAIRDGTADFTVLGFGDVHRNIDQRRAGAPPYDFCWITATPPDDAGYCCVGAELWDLRTAMRRSGTTVAAVNPHLPRTFGDTRIHVSEIDMFVAEPRPLRSRSPLTPSPTAVTIAEHVAPLVPHRATLQIGAGKTSGALALAGAFDDKEDLGYFAETSAPGLTNLVARGVITSKYATVRANRFVTTGLTGGAEDYAFVRDNPFFEFYDYDTMLSPAVIARNDNLVTINNALSMDLRGQIVLVGIGPAIRSGSGGQLGYQMGAYLSRGGRAITVLPSTTADGTVSRIVPQFPAGQTVTIPWDIADTVVTEYGVAELLGRSIRQRAQALIEIAHPDHRAGLRAAARRFL